MRIGEIFPDKKGFPVFTMLRSMELSSDPTKPAEFFAGGWGFGQGDGNQKWFLFPLFGGAGCIHTGD